MASPSRRDEALRRASSLIAADFDSDYILNKLIKEGIDADEAVTVLQTLTGKPIAKHEATHPNPPQAKPVIQWNGLPREEAAKRATALLDSGYRAGSVREKLLSEGYNAGDVQAVLERVTKQQTSQNRRLMQDFPVAKRSRDIQVISGVAMLVFACALSYLAVQAGRSSGSFILIFVLGLGLAAAFSILRGLSS